jgi:hypothetical protein
VKVTVESTDTDLVLLLTLHNLLSPSTHTRWTDLPPRRTLYVMDRSTPSPNLIRAGQISPLAEPYTDNLKVVAAEPNVNA